MMCISRLSASQACASNGDGDPSIVTFCFESRLHHDRSKGPTGFIFIGRSEMFLAEVQHFKIYSISH